MGGRDGPVRNAQACYRRRKAFPGRWDGTAVCTSYTKCDGWYEVLMVLSRSQASECPDGRGLDRDPTPEV